MSNQDIVQLKVRCPRELVERLDAYVEQEQMKDPYVPLSRESVLRKMIDKVLERIENRTTGACPDR